MKNPIKALKLKLKTANSPEQVSPAWELTALTPEFIESEHAQYAATIAKNIKNEDVRNIALSGNYGVGKSSILRRVSEDHKGRVVELSLSTLSPIEASQLDESVPVQATTPTNRIQQEIVKQLLYRAEPKSARASRFRRIEHFRWWRELALSVVMSVGVTVAFLILGWASKIEHTFRPLFELGLWIYPILILLASAAILATRVLLQGRIHIKQFSAGPAAVTLDEKSVSYFDQYLDEIVYFFETSSRDIVIFEDIDRFNDSHIFETLRSLNALLNASPKIKKPIRFIYAIKDSIFDSDGLKQEGRKGDAAHAGIADPAQAEIIRANRTKFFDLVIPVVPFITHRSARNLTAQILKDIEHKISNDLIDLAARFVPDMRLLKNVRNEFVVFRDRIFSGDGKHLNLSETHLFAMMLYKSTHLSDFEVVRLGESKLDQLYKASRALIVGNIRERESELRAARTAVASRKAASEKAVRLGKRLVSGIDLIVRTARLQRQHGQYRQGGSAVQANDFETVEFWEVFGSQEGNPTVGWYNPRYGQEIQLSRADVAGLVGETLDVTTWSQADEKAHAVRVRKIEDELKFLRSADMNDLMHRPEFRMDFENEKYPFSKVAESLFTKGLVYSLIQDGYIDRNFTLYTSTFHGNRVSPAATNFIIHHVERDLMDEQFVLTPEDVEAVIRERGVRSLAESAMFNIAILDHLLRSNNPDAELMVDALAHLNNEGKRFLQAYFSSGAFKELLAKKLTARSPNILEYLVGGVELDDETQKSLVSVALLSLTEKMNQTVTNLTKDYLHTNYGQLASIRSERLTTGQADLIALLFKEAGVLLPDLATTSDSVRPAFVKYGLYEMSLDNLRAAVGDDRGLSLDELRVLGLEDVYTKALSELSIYLDAVDGHSSTNNSVGGFVPVIKDVLKAAPELLDCVVGGASDESRVEDLETVPQEAWSILAAHNRFSPTFSNITAYIEQVGKIDEHLAFVLKKSQAVTAHEDVAENEKQDLAVKLIGAKTKLGPILRATLAESLKLTEWIPLSNLNVEDGELYRQLIMRRVISGEAETYEHLLAANWDTRERVITVMPEFHEWITPELVNDDLAVILASPSVSEQAKRAILNRASEYTSAAGRQELTEIARLALLYGLPISFDVVAKMAENRINIPDVIALLSPHLGSILDEQLFDLLRALGSPYSELTIVGRDKPKVANTVGTVELLEALRSRGVVASFNDSKNLIIVSKRRKELT